MWEVETLKPHRNAFGARREKDVGDKYACPKDHARVLIDQDLVKRVAKDAKAKKREPAPEVADTWRTGESDKDTTPKDEAKAPGMAPQGTLAEPPPSAEGGRD